MIMARISCGAVLLLLVSLRTCCAEDVVAVVDDSHVLYSEVMERYAALESTGQCGKVELVDAPNAQRWEALPQTPNRLLQVMHKLGYHVDDLALVRDCMSLNVKAFGTTQRRSGRSLTAHCIGTAGALAIAGKPAKQICAAAIHSIYAFANTPGFTRCELDNPAQAEDCLDVEKFKQERRRVAALTSAEIERLVAFYQLFPSVSMDSIDVQRCAQRVRTEGVESFGEMGAWSIAMHVANELDEYIHWDSIIGPSRRRPLHVIIDFLQLAEAFGEHVLAEGLYYAYSQYLHDKELEGLIKTGGRGSVVKGFPELERFEALAAVDGRLGWK